MRTVTKLEYRIPGIIVDEEGSLTVDHRDPEHALTQIPDHAHSFRFVTLTYLSATSELGETVELPPTRSEETGWHFPDGTLYDLPTVQAMAERDPDRYRILAANMTGNGWNPVVRTRRGNFTRFEDGDRLFDTVGSER